MMPSVPLAAPGRALPRRLAAMPSDPRSSFSCGMRRAGLAAVLIALLASWASPAFAQDPEAPDGAPKHWLANEPWVNYLWLPYEEARLYELIGKSRGEVFRWVP